MKTGLTLVELAAEIQRQAEAKQDYLVRTDAAEAVPVAPGRVDLALRGGDALGDTQLAINSLAHDQLGSYAGIPAQYYDRMLAEQPDLLATNLNTWLSAKPATRMVRTLDGHVRAWLSNSYRPLDYVDMAEAVLPVLGALELEVLSCQVTDLRLYIKAVDRRITKDVPTGRRMGDGSHVFFDTVSPAIVISNSEVGCGALAIEAGVWTKVCTNMAIASSRSMRKFHLGGRADLGADMMALLSDDTRRKTDAALWAQARDIVQAAFDRAAFEASLRPLEEAAQQPLEGDPVKAVEVVGKKLGLNDGERTSVLNHLIRGGDLTRYGLHAAVTRAAEDVDSYDRATDLERAGTKVIELDRRDWFEVAQGGRKAA